MNTKLLVYVIKTALLVHILKFKNVIMIAAAKGL